MKEKELSHHEILNKWIDLDSMIPKKFVFFSCDSAADTRFARISDVRRLGSQFLKELEKKLKIKKKLKSYLQE